MEKTVKDEDLKKVAGGNENGNNPYGVKCPNCGSLNVKGDVFGAGLVLYYCLDCDCEFDLEPKH